MRMVGRDRVDMTFNNSLPQRLAIGGLAHRRVHLCEDTLLGVNIVREVMRASFDEDLRPSSRCLSAAR